MKNLAKSSPKYHVIFRTCDQVVSVHGLPRPFGLDKQKLIKICFLSLYESLQAVPHSIHVLGDKISESLEQFFNQYPIKLITGDWGNDASLRKSFELGLNFPSKDWVYFCEDDYLHQLQTFKFIDDLIQNRTKYLEYIPRPFYMRLPIKNFTRVPLVIHPPDYPDRYKPKQLRPSFIFLSDYCHWRQVTNTTFTFLLQAQTLKKYEKELQYSSVGAKDRRLSRKLYGFLLFHRKTLCLSPLPGLACHMHEPVFTPFVEWEKVFEKNWDLYKNRYSETLWVV